MYRTFNCKLDFIFLKSLRNVSKHVFAINIWLPCEKFYTEEDFNRSVCRQQLCFYMIIIIICEFTPKVHSLEELFIKRQAATSSLRHSILFLVSQLFQGGLTSGCSEYHLIIPNSSNVLSTFWEWSQGPQPLLESLLL